MMSIYDLPWTTLRPIIAEDVKSKTGGHCYYCGEVLDGEFDVDHMHPVSKGGTSHIDNLVPSCKGCNQSKHSLTIEGFRRFKTMAMAMEKHQIPHFKTRQLDWLEANGIDIFSAIGRHKFWFESAANDNVDYNQNRIEISR
jgi:5-methylcytosine-specific restriction endonuclease McrA